VAFSQEKATLHDMKMAICESKMLRARLFAQAPLEIADNPSAAKMTESSW
jgi:hypothetical protein